VSAAVVTVIEAVLAGGRSAAGDRVEVKRGSGRALAETASIIALAIATARAGARDADTLAIASDKVALGILAVEVRLKALRVQRVGRLGSGDLDEFIGIVTITTLGEAPPSVRAVAGQRVQIALLASVAGEATRASSRGNDASLTDITTNLGLITIVHGELEAVTMDRVKVEKIKIPHDLSTISVDSWLSVGGVDKANG
jgi:hypothetical protein